MVYAHYDVTTARDQKLRIVDSNAISAHISNGDVLGRDFVRWSNWVCLTLILAIAFPSYFSLVGTARHLKLPGKRHKA
jgi:hypothetical protein